MSATRSSSAGAVIAGLALLRCQVGDGNARVALDAEGLAMDEGRMGDVEGVLHQPQPDAFPDLVELVDAAEMTPEVEAAHRAFEQEHASEIAAEEGKPFELVKEDETPPETVSAGPEEAAPAEPNAAPQEAAAVSAPGPAAAISPQDSDEFEAHEQKRLTVLQRVSKLNVGKRIQLGFIGNKEERALKTMDKTSKHAVAT